VKNLLLFPIIFIVIFSNSVQAENEFDSETVFHDPFKKPEFTRAPVKRSLSKNLDQTDWTPQLIMTLRAGKNSMANIGGKIIKLGEKIEDYKLIKVSERAVVLLKQGKTMHLTLDE